MKKEILVCDNLVKFFGKKQVLFDVSFKLNEGDILGFIGPNGSGKTTTIKLILGLQNIKSGKVYINGYDIEKDFKKAIERVGTIVENPDFYMYLSGYDNLKLIANMYDNINNERINEVVKLVGLEHRIKDKVSKYSLGMRERLGIASALLNDPNILILDEPTNGLDPEGIKELRELIINLSKKNVGVLISSHNLSELESFCNKVCVIQNGHVTLTNDIKSFVHNEDIYYFEVDDVSHVKDKDINIINNTMFSKLILKKDVPHFIKKLVKDNVLVYMVHENDMSLEEAFLKVTGGNKID